MNGPKPRLGLALFLPTLLGVAVVASVAWLGFSALLRQSAQAHLSAALPPIATLLQPRLGEESAELHRHIRELVVDPRLRLTVIEADGVVIADSSRDELELRQMDNHRTRPEIASAFREGSGTSTRASATLGQTMVYAAVSIEAPDGRPVVVRLAEPVTSLEELRERVLLLIVLASAAALTAMGLVGLWFHRDLFRPLAELVRHAENLAPGRPAPVLPEPRAPEAAAIARAFNHLARRAEEKVGELEAERRSLESILASLSDGVVVIDSEGRIARSNPAAAQMFGWESSGQAPESFLGALPEREEHVLRTQTLRDGKQTILELEIDETGHTVAMVCTPLEQAGGAVITARDLTEALHLGEVRRDLVANVSHELKTPLTAIRGYAETLADGGVDDAETRDRFVQRIVQQCKRLQALLTDLLKLSWLEDDSAKADLARVPFDEVVAESLEVVLPSAAAKALRIETHVMPVVLESASREALAELCLNLLDNAIKYNREGGSLEVRLESDNGRALFSVADTGRGIPKTALHRIFERFYRVDRGRGRSEGGTGLGLAIVKHAVERHDGDISVTSDLGRGTTFRVSLPLDSQAKKKQPEGRREAGTPRSYS